MIRSLHIVALLLSLSLPVFAAGSFRAVDGDTAKGPDGVLIRVVGIDTPEMRGRCQSEIERARAAQVRLQSLLDSGATLELVRSREGVARRDRYGRLLGTFRLPDGRDVGAIMVSEGFAREYDGRGPRQGWC